MEPKFKLHQKVELLDELIPDTTETYKGEVVGFFVSNFKDEEGNSQYMYQTFMLKDVISLQQCKVWYL